MNIEILNTGTELLLGRVLNSHQAWLCRQLSDHGYRVRRQVTVDDTGPAIQAALREALGRADLVLTTGGLGPTGDDRTRPIVADLLGRRLLPDASVRKQIRAFFARRGRPQPPQTVVQSMVPEGAVVLPNAFGTAPGLAIAVPGGQFRPGPAGSWLFLLPGPPHELRPMFTHQVLPRIRKQFPPEGRFVCRTLRSTGLGESLVEARIAGPLERLLGTGLEVGYCARPSEVDVRLTARGRGAAQIVAAAERIIRGQLEEFIFGTDDEELETVLVRLLTERRQTLAVAESCTGGLLAQRLTNVPGASAVFLAGLITYSNQAKERFLQVRPATLRRHGAVSEATAWEMAAGARSQTGADYALAVTGIAGPGGGSAAKPVGTVFIGLAAGSETVVRRFFNPLDRQTFKHVTAQQAFELLRRRLTHTPGGSESHPH